MRIYVGNLPFDTTENDLRGLFEQHGTVESVRIVIDRNTNRPRGFGFVDMEPTEAKAAIKALDGTDLGGRNMKVNQAEERTAAPRPRQSW